MVTRASSGGGGGGGGGGIVGGAVEVGGVGLWERLHVEHPCPITTYTLPEVVDEVLVHLL